MGFERCVLQRVGRFELSGRAARGLRAKQDVEIANLSRGCRKF
jgi:hypothetical protein